MTAHTNPNAAHAVYAPSSAHRWMHCTASAGAIAALGEREEGEEAKKGTAAHEEIERVLGALPSVGAVDSSHPAAYGIALVVSYVQQLPPGRFWIEQRVRLTDEIWGRCDVAHWDAASETLTIVDYKNGYVGVDAEENEQLRIYAAGSIYTHNLPAKWIRYAVVQPNDFRPVPRVKQWSESADALYAFAQRAAAVPHGKLEFVAGQQCTYCPLFGRCPASKDVLADFAKVIVHDAADVPAAQVAKFAACEKPIADWFKAFNKAQLAKALNGAPAPGMKLVTGRTVRAWLDEDKARDFVLQHRGLAELCAPTPAQAEKLGLDVSTMAKAPEGAPVLAFENDKRPAFARKSAVDMFAGAVKS